MAIDPRTWPPGRLAARLDAWTATVSCATWLETRRVLNLARAGTLVLRTPRPPAPGAHLKLALKLPDGETVHLRGRALDVHFLDRGDGEVEARVRAQLVVDASLIERSEVELMQDDDEITAENILARGTGANGSPPGWSSSTTYALHWRRRKRGE